MKCQECSEKIKNEKYINAKLVCERCFYKIKYPERFEDVEKEN